MGLLCSRQRGDVPAPRGTHGETARTSPVACGMARRQLEHISSSCLCMGAAMSRPGRAAVLSMPPIAAARLQVPTCSGEFKQRMVQLLDDVKEGRLHQPAPQRQQQGKQHHAQPAAVAAGVVG